MGRMAWGETDGPSAISDPRAFHQQSRNPTRASDIFRGAPLTPEPSFWPAMNFSPFGISLVGRQIICMCTKPLRDLLNASLVAAGVSCRRKQTFCRGTAPSCLTA